MGVRHPIALSVAGLTALAAAGLLGGMVLDVLRRRANGLGWAFLQSIRDRRRTYAGFLVHAGFVCLAIGVTGSSLGTTKHDFDVDAGETIHWAGRSIHFARLIQTEFPDRLVIEAQLDVAQSHAAAFTLLPAQHLHRRQRQWTTEVAIHSTWMEDLYAILRGGEARSKIHLTLVVNPMMRWLWLGGCVAAIGALCGLLPARRRAAERSAAAAPHWTKTSRRAPSSTLRGADDR
jgi:cytochrome c-type biogenesis protein CcmF